MTTKTKWILFMLLMIVLILVEIACARLAYETLGEIMSSIYAVAVALNLVPLLLFFRHRAAAVLIALALALIIIPYQLILVDRWQRAQAEADRILVYANEQRSLAGRYPNDLIGYSFQDREMQTYLNEYLLDDTRGGFVLSYWVGTPTTSHTYSPATGWTYYPD